MRHIDKSRFDNCKTKTWDKNTVKWSQQVANSADKNAQIDAIGNKWKSLKRAFVKEFGAKCWYSEAPQIGTDCDVDHYWPKGRVRLENGDILQSAAGQHPGYWWKAFDITNYRYSCIYANRSREEGGKIDFFPLVDETNRAWSAASNCDYAQRAILDPCSLEDVKLLTFEFEDWKTASFYSEQQDPIAYRRVKLSKAILNLDEATILAARREHVRKIKKALFALSLAEKIPPEELEDDEAAELQDTKRLIVEACDRKSEFSAAVVQMILPHKHRPYLADILPLLDLEP